MPSRTGTWTGMRELAPVPGYVVMQPTTLCNLSCTYCYLPDRAYQRRMPVEVAEATAEAVNGWAAEQPGFSVVWHGSEPLAAGRAALAELMAPFVGVEHQVQTNATLVDDAWCELFVERGVRVSISVDGPEEYNTQRVTRDQKPIYKRIMKGVAALRRHGIGFSVLCVVSAPRPGLASRLYDYFLELGCDVLGISLEEHEGVNERSNARDEDTVRAFWSELVAAWRRDPRIHIREVEHGLGYAAAVLAGTADEVLPRRIDPMPMIATDGRVFLLSPELAGFHDPDRGDFSSGNVLTTPLAELLRDAVGGTPWIGEYLRGVEACRRECPYFGFCGGAHAANRYFEHGRFDVTRTNHCRNSKIRLLDGVLDHVPPSGQPRPVPAPVPVPARAASMPAMATAALAAAPGAGSAPAAAPGAGSAPAAAPGAGSAVATVEAVNTASASTTATTVVRHARRPADPVAARIHGLADGLTALLAEAAEARIARNDTCDTFYNWHNRPR